MLINGICTRICNRKWVAKISSVFEIQTDHAILTKKLDGVLKSIKKRTYHFMDFVVQRAKLIKSKDRQVCQSWRIAEKAVEHEGDGDIDHSWSPWNDLEWTRLEELEMKGKDRDHSDYSTVKINKHTLKNSANLRELAVSQTPGINYPCGVKNS